MAAHPCPIAQPGSAAPLAELFEETRGTFQVKPGSLFPSLHRMEEAGWLSASWGASENNRRAKYYRLTAAGRRQLDAETGEWKRIAVAIAYALQAT